MTAADTLLETLDSLHGEMREAIAAGDMGALGQLDQQRQDVIAAALPDHATAGHVEILAGLIEQDHALQQNLHHLCNGQDSTISAACVRSANTSAKASGIILIATGWAFDHQLLHFFDQCCPSQAQHISGLTDHTV